MIQLPNYQITQQIYTGTRTTVYRGINTINQQPVVIKVLNKEYPTFSELLQFRHQYTITKNLNFPGIVKPISLEKSGNGYALIMEDIGAVSLKTYLTNQKLNLANFIELAISIVEILEDLYHHQIIHKDIKPSNIVINPDTKDVKLIDFSISTLLPRETQEIINPNVLEGTLAYMSPEQTGRMNRGIDYRSDFYSLGITFYEIITNQLPFFSNDPIELVYFHIAKEPTPPTELNTAIPRIISNIIMKLLAKNAELRYQNAFGLKQDLQTCLKSWQETEKIPTFELGKRDISDRFSIPEKLYGRQEEVKSLLDAFERVSNPPQTPLSKGGGAEIMLVAGFSGIGKTAVINEVHKPIVRQRGYFIKGKFDQFQRNIPFSALVQAFRYLMGELLGETANQLQEWKSKIISELGENGQVIIEVIPELELIISHQPAVEELSGSAAENRFNLLFLKFIKIFATQEHPLVIFVDDLQWADPASLKLMQLLMSEKNSQHLLLLGAYRDNEVNPTHPLILTLEEIVKKSAIVKTITLKPLELISDLNPLVADTLHCAEERAFPLAELVYQKTQGNPFFITQFLKALYKEGLITFNYEVGYWECDIAEVKLFSLTDDVVEFMATRLQKLSPETQEVMKLAACIGNKFDLETLAIVSEKSVGETANNLWEALPEGLILPVTEVYKFYTSEESSKLTDFKGRETDASYKFLHDRVQQAAYLLIPEEQKQATHLKIGRLLLENIPENEKQEKIFDIVNQLNYGIDLISRLTEREQLAQLNLMAGKKAKLSTAYNAAVNYLNTGLELLTANSWEMNYQLTLALYVEAAEVRYLVGEYEQIEQLAEVVQQEAKNLLEKVPVYMTKIKSEFAQNQIIKGIDLAIVVIKNLGLELSPRATEAELFAAIEKLQSFMSDRSTEELKQLPEMKNPEKLALIQLLGLIGAAAFVVGSPLWASIIFAIVTLSVEWGNTPASAYGYSCYGILLWRKGEIKAAYELSEVIFGLFDRFGGDTLRGVTVANHHLRHWQEHLANTLPLFLECYSLALSRGDFEFAGYNIFLHSFHSYFVGWELTELSQKLNNAIDAVVKIKQETPLTWLQMNQQTVLNLSDRSENPCMLVGEAFDETKIQPEDHGLVYLHLHKLYLCYLFGDYQESLKFCLAGQPYLHLVTSHYSPVFFYFYGSLIRLALYNEGSETEQQKWLEEVASNQEQMKIWAHHAPVNFLHKFHLVEAEKHRVFHNYIEAIELYEQAIASATENEYIQEVALANELAAKFYLEWNKQTIAQAYLIKAYYAYAKWGAVAKLKHLEKCYGDLLKPIQQKDSNSTRSLTTETVTYTSSETFLALDFSSLIKATQAISGEIQLENLLSVLMRVTLENAAAQKGYLIFPQGENLVIEAKAIRNSNQDEELQLISRQSLAIDSTNELPNSLIYYVARTQKTMVLDDASNEAKFVADPYIQNYQPKSILCIPIINCGKFIGILYLENHLTVGAFTSERLEVLKVLTTTAAFSLENARLYENLSTAKNQLQEYSHTLEDKVKKRTEELNEKNLYLSETLQQLKNTQAQLIQTEKMSSLGQMVAGIAHEMNNPVSFIYGNIKYASQYSQELLDLINLYQQEYPNPTSKIAEKMEELDLEFLTEDFEKLLNSLKVGSERIKNIVESLRNFSRLDESDMKPVNIHAGIDSTLLILQNRLNPQRKKSEIKVVKNYGDLPLVNCYASQLNQVFMNILSNGIYALEDNRKNDSEFHQEPKIIISTEITNYKMIKIKIANNGPSISQENQQKIFDPFFTTKPVGTGTGLGLSISYSIVVEKHQGKLSCNSEPGQGVEFAIEIPF
ncbi:MAG: AAA family ATPase [Okeania sp. SIO3I5]|uniref:trifunctional serine/threonine-protein kinase/ATP-binding protein/sensor histidine kinase n=1 Tax=Okeania sp. SIO3I5 TaxID=2607805 RepID=UPI0013B92BDA|nr:ATP-binding sensor histidine kinase [Okeania sp. SIO3I5]NEQ39938.1 AAA family ATPase [Okeania sp. SIO3I5]